MDSKFDNPELLKLIAEKFDEISDIFYKITKDRPDSIEIILPNTLATVKTELKGMLDGGDGGSCNSNTVLYSYTTATIEKIVPAPGSIPPVKKVRCNIH